MPRSNSSTCSSRPCWAEVFHGHFICAAKPADFWPVRFVLKSDGAAVIFVLGLLALAVFVYLMYSLVRPEDF
ncbi:potassium-transporting ATPase subunit F [Deinococcus detaillensis]|uniref:Potassium-transporting ATPase subunit F n=1 Tax=Deinococcus detaillensis TaxID=2592048 RepID=A0A553UP92_9DEIO|nr:potassium-transporting ATPase subunit F [Deinococcus detaillensis]